MACRAFTPRDYQVELSCLQQLHGIVDLSILHHTAYEPKCTAFLLVPFPLWGHGDAFVWMFDSLVAWIGWRRLAWNSKKMRGSHKLFDTKAKADAPWPAETLQLVRQGPRYRQTVLQSDSLCPPPNQMLSIEPPFFGLYIFTLMSVLFL